MCVIPEKNSIEYWNYKNVITRAIGTSRRVRADFFEYDLLGKERVLLCSDGLTNMVKEVGLKNPLEDGCLEDVVKKMEAKLGL